jgi:hypothetical protein
VPLWSERVLTDFFVASDIERCSQVEERNNTEKALPLVGKIFRFTYWSVYQGIRRWSHSKQQQKNERLKAKKAQADFKKYKDRGREEYNTCGIHDQSKYVRLLFVCYMPRQHPSAIRLVRYTVPKSPLPGAPTTRYTTRPRFPFPDPGTPYFIISK